MCRRGEVFLFEDIARLCPSLSVCKVPKLYKYDALFTETPV